LWISEFVIHFKAQCNDSPIEEKVCDYDKCQRVLYAFYF
jgi:hypothetical protein